MCAWQLEALYPDVYKNVHEYGNRYCKGVSRIFIWWQISFRFWLFLLPYLVMHTVVFSKSIDQGVFGIYQGASNHEELHNLMKATAMIRRLKKDVLAQLPVKRRQQVYFYVNCD